MKQLIPLILLMISLGSISGYAEPADSLNPLYKALPAAHISEVTDWEKIKTSELPFSRTQGVFKGESETGQWVGTVVHLISPGYGGPIGLLVAFDTEGKILRVDVFQHNETDCHILPMKNGNFLEQYKGISFLEKLTLMIGLAPTKRGEVQAMTGGTITSRAVTEAVVEARKVIYSLYKNDEFKKPAYAGSNITLLRR